MATLSFSLLCGTRKYDVDFDTAYYADVGDWHDSAVGIRRCGAELPVPGSEYRIYRVYARISVPDIEINSAFFQSRNVYSSEGFTLQMLDASSITSICADEHYGDILDLTSVLGSITFPSGISGEHFWRIYFNETGLAFLNSKRGNTANLAFRSNYHPGYSGAWGWASLWTPGYGYSETYLNEGDSYIWVEGTYLAYTDAFGQKRLEQGSTTGQTATVSSEPWVEGDYIHYIDASLDERRILGSTTGLSGKVAGQISVNTKAGISGTKLCYIDSSGNERCFEGTAA